MSGFYDYAIHPDKLLQRHAVAQWHQKPSEDVAWCNVGEKRIVLHHRYGVDGEEEPSNALVKEELIGPT